MLGVATAVSPPVAPTARLERQARQVGAQAYVYGLAALDEQRVISRLPPNTLVSLTQPATAAERLVVLPNVDTLYTTARLDLRAGPVVVGVPDEHGRYYVLQFIDAYTNTFAYVGRRSTGTRAGQFALIPPGWHGRVPPGVRRIQAPTATVWMLGRTLVDGPRDIANVNRIQHGYTLTPLRQYGGAPSPALFLPASPARPRALPSGLGFFDEMDRVIAANPPPRSERALLRRFAGVGLGPGATPSSEHLSSAVRDGLLAGISDGRRQLRRYVSETIAASARTHRGWLMPPPDTGDFGANYLLRAFIAQTALGANRPVEAVYPGTGVDRRGHSLTGAQRYVLHFARGQLPPVNAFWSLTVYDSSLSLVANPLDRYAIGNRTPGVRRNRDGSLDILLQVARPARDTSNWLPVPKGRFQLTLRLYEPRPSVIKGSWPLPTVTRVG